MKRLPPHREELARLVEEGIDLSSLARAALLIACEAQPALDVEHSLSRIHQLGQRYASVQREHRRSLRDRIEALNDVLFEEYGVKGDTDSYYDPRNSFLDQVLERRSGIPITISILFIAVGQLGGLDVRGVGLPGHFIVKVVDGAHEVYVDPFHKGQLLTIPDCRRRVKTVLGEGHAWRDEYLAETPPRDILVRVLNNLKSIFLQATDFKQTLWVQDLLVMLHPDDAVQYRDRGLVHAQLQRYADARRDLRDYLERWPGRAPDADEIENDLERLRRLHHMLN